VIESDRAAVASGVRHEERATRRRVGNAVHIPRIATGEIEEKTRDPAKEPIRLARRNGSSAT
jgi:hypothetical protein